jgi:hypothetical protein
LLLVLYIEKHHTDHIVKSLHIANFVVVVCIGFQNVKKLVVACSEVFSPQLQVGQRARNVFAYHVLSFFISEGEQLAVEFGAVVTLSLLNVEEFQPKLSTLALGDV